MALMAMCVDRGLGGDELYDELGVDRIDGIVCAANRVLSVEYVIHVSGWDVLQPLEMQIAYLVI